MCILTVKQAARIYFHLTYKASVALEMRIQYEVVERGVTQFSHAYEEMSDHCKEVLAMVAARSGVSRLELNNEVERQMHEFFLLTLRNINRS